MCNKCQESEIILYYLATEFVIPLGLVYLTQSLDVSFTFLACSRLFHFGLTFPNTVMLRQKRLPSLLSDLAVFSYRYSRGVATLG